MSHARVVCRCWFGCWLCAREERARVSRMACWLGVLTAEKNGVGRKESWRWGGGAGRRVLYGGRRGKRAGTVQSADVTRPQRGSGCVHRGGRQLCNHRAERASCMTTSTRDSNEATRARRGRATVSRVGGQHRSCGEIGRARSCGENRTVAPSRNLNCCCCCHHVNFRMAAKTRTAHHQW